MSENGFLMEGLFYGVAGCVGTVYNGTVCEDTVRITTIVDWTVNWGGYLACC